MRILLVCPAGMGKTYYIIQQITQGKISQKWCFIAPLRAIIEEVHEKLTQKGIKCLNIQSAKDRERIDGHSVILSTSNLLTQDNLVYLNKKGFVFVIDEFHLIFRWGPSFREDLNQLYFFILGEARRYFLLTATIEQQFLRQLIRDLTHEKKSILKLDYGNLSIKRDQIRMVTYMKNSHESRTKMLNLGARVLFEKKRILYFVPYRNDVARIEDFFKGKGFITLTAKGGEALDFTQKLKQIRSQVQVIITTSVLSHGVNLPTLDHLFLLYPVKKRDFWVQMVYRAGRQGETFYLHHFDKELVSKKDMIKGYFWNIRLKIQILINQVCREFY